MTPKKYTQEELNKVLWNAADSSRSSVDAGIYKDYALTMLFFKYLSDMSNRQILTIYIRTWKKIISVNF